MDMIEDWGERRAGDYGPQDHSRCLDVLIAAKQEGIQASGLRQHLLPCLNLGSWFERPFGGQPLVSPSAVRGQNSIYQYVLGSILDGLLFAPLFVRTLI